MNTQVELDQLRRSLDADSRAAWVRALLLREGDDWVLYSAWVLIGTPPPSWKPKQWRYAEHAFVGHQVPASDLSVLCSTEGGGVLKIGPLEVKVPAANGPANQQRHPSFSMHDRPQLPFPVSDLRISPGDFGNRRIPHALLVGEGDTPSFPQPESAWRAFTEDNYALSAPPTPPSELALLRIAQRDGWLGRVQVTATQLTVCIEGDHVAGTDLELFGLSGRTVQRLDGPGDVTIALPDGLPADAWLWLKRGTDWLDYRSLDPGSTWTGNLDSSGVQIEVPVDPQASVEALIASGENYQVEFKEMLPNGKDQRRMLKSVAAFATGDGGTIVFGVHRDEMTITGVGQDGVPAVKQRDDLVNLVRASVVPMPQIHLQDYEVQGQLVIVMKVDAGQSPPYALSMPLARDKPEYFVRRGSNTYSALPGELREATLAKVPASPPSRIWGHG